MLFPDVVFSKILSYISAPEICTVDIYVHLPRNHDFSNKRNYPFYDPKTVTIKDVKLQLSYHMNTISFFKIVDDILYDHRFINFQHCRRIPIGHVYHLENCDQFICHNDLTCGDFHNRFYCDCLKIWKVDTRRKHFKKHNYYICDIQFQMTNIRFTGSEKFVGFDPTYKCIILKHQPLI